MLIDGQFIAISDEKNDDARKQMELPADFILVEATGLLHHETGNGVTCIRLPPGLFVAAFENRTGLRRYGVVRM